MIRIDSSLTARPLRGAMRSACLRSRRRRSARLQQAGTRPGARRSSRSGRYTVARLDGVDPGLPSTARPSCSSTPRATRRPLPSAATARCNRMATHVSHIGVHDHGFNNVSTYGEPPAAWRARAGCAADPGEIDFYELALKVDRRRPGRALDRPARRASGYIYSFNGPHSLFADTIRSLRVPRRSATSSATASWASATAGSRCSSACSQHAETTARYNVYFGEGRDRYDVPGPRRPRVDLQPQRRLLPLPEHPAGLFALLDLDPRPGLDPLRLRRAARIPRHAPGSPSLAPAAAKRTVLARFLEPSRRPRPISTSTNTPTRRHPLLGHRRARAGPPGRLPRPAGRALQRPRAGRQLGGGHRRPGPVRLGSYLSARSAGAARAPATWRPASRSRGRSSATLPFASPRHEGLSCTPSTTGPTAGTTSRRAGRSRAANRPCGATITPASWRSSSCGWPRAEPYYTFFIPQGRTPP